MELKRAVVDLVNGIAKSLLALNIHKNALKFIAPENISSIINNLIVFLISLICRL